MQNAAVIRETRSVCPDCLRPLPAAVVEREGLVVLEKRCPDHGTYRLLLSRHPDYYRDLNAYYFAVVDTTCPQRDYIVNLTNRCNLRCPICLTDAGSGRYADISVEALKKFLKGRRRHKIDLMGAEPTMREDLVEIVRLVRRSGNIAALHTNGIRLADLEYLKRLLGAGLAEVHLQFDGFDDEAYRTLRGEALLEVKLKVLGHLKQLGVPTDLVATIGRGINECQMKLLLDYGAKEDFVREVFYLGCRFLGRARGLSPRISIMPDELIDVLEAQTDGAINRRSVREFQRLYFALLAAFSVKKCFYIQHFIVFRQPGGFLALDKVFDLAGLQKHLFRFRDLRVKHHPLASAYLVASLILQLMRRRNRRCLCGLLSYFKPFIRGFDLSRLSRRCLLLGFISACDAYSLDYDIARNCGKGSLSTEFGVQDSGAFYNVLSDIPMRI